MNTLFIISFTIWLTLGLSVGIVAGIDMYKTQIKFTLSDLFMCLVLTVGGLFTAIMAILEYVKDDTVLLKKKM